MERVSGEKELKDKSAFNHSINVATGLKKQPPGAPVIWLKTMWADGLRLPPLFCSYGVEEIILIPGMPMGEESLEGAGLDSVTH
jgi:hypothetical protein